MKVKKGQKLLLFVFILQFLLLFGLGIGTQAGLGAAGTAGTFADNTVATAIEDAWVTFFFEGLSTGSEYIMVESTVGNTTFSTGTGQTTAEITLKVDASGSLAFSIYGYNVSSGASSGSILDTWLLTVTPSSDFDADQITGAIPLFIGLLIGGLILGIAVKRSF